MLRKKNVEDTTHRKATNFYLLVKRKAFWESEQTGHTIPHSLGSLAILWVDHSSRLPACWNHSTSIFPSCQHQPDDEFSE